MVVVVVVSLDATTRAKIDRRITRYVREIFGLPYSTPTSVVNATGMVCCLTGMIAQHRERLCMQCRDPLSHTQLASIIYNSLVDDGPGKLTAYANMPSRARREKTEWVSKGVAAPPLMPPPYAVAAEASMFGLRVTAYEWQHRSRLSLKCATHHHAWAMY